MASEAQIRANRENAKRSTGPRSAAGRLRSSRNAMKHGLSLPLAADSEALAQARRLVEFLASGCPDQGQSIMALELAKAQAQLLRVAAVRNDVVANLNLKSISFKQVRRLAALDRYERRALMQRIRAARVLWGNEPAD